MTVLTGDCIRATAVLMGPKSQAVQNVFYYKYVGSTGESDAIVMQTIADHLDGNVYMPINGHIVDGCTYEEIQFYNMTQDNPMGIEPWPTLTAGGQVTAAGLPEAVAACVTASTAVKKVKPKKYFGVMTESGQAEGEWGNTEMVDLATTAGEWLQTLHTIYGSLLPATWSRALGIVILLVGAVVRSICSSQRRRKPGIGA